MCDLVIIDESTPLTDEQMKYMIRKTKISKLANLLREIKYPVFPDGLIVADLGVQFQPHVYEVIAKYLVDHGVEVDVVRCGECEHLICGCGCKMFGGPDYYPVVLHNDYCSYGKRREENGK